MPVKYKTSAIITSILLIINLIIGIDYLKYTKDKKLENTIVVVNNSLSINFEHGQIINVDNKDATYHFSVTNNSKNSIFYYIEIQKVVSNKETYDFSLEQTNGKLAINQTNFPAQDAYLANFLEISPNTTQYFDLKISGNNALNFKAKLSIGIENEIEEYFASTILKNNEVKSATITQVAAEIASNDEGLIETIDDLGNSYYFRGNVSNNYVSFADKLWRIVKINGDGTVKLILDDYLANNELMYQTEDEKDIATKLNLMNSSVYEDLQTFYQAYLGNYDKYISNSKICIDDSISKINDNNTTYYMSYNRSETDYNPTFNCGGSTYSSKIGLLTVDEVLYAGASKNSDNSSFYLYTSDKTTSWWTMTPASSTKSDVFFFTVTNNGKLLNSDNGSYYRGVRPVINLIKKVSVSGNGTKTDPYQIKES